MNSDSVALPLKKFLLVEECPDAWKRMDLYLFRDETTAFYAGQSHHAFSRVWAHLLGGFHGHSTIGRFIWCNWPKSMSFTIELFNSQSPQFAKVGNDINASERLLIQRWSPCFNISQNLQPAPLTPPYVPPNAPFRRKRSLTMLIREAERAVKADETKLWLEQLES